MKDFLSEYVGKLIRTLAICTMIIVLPLIFNGQLMLIGALLVGYLAAAICIWTLVYRTWKSASLDAASAKKQMLWGLTLRLVVLAAAVNISVAVFAATAGGFLLCYALAMAHLIHYNQQSDKKATKGRQRLCMKSVFAK